MRLDIIDAEADLQAGPEADRPADVPADAEAGRRQAGQDAQADPGGRRDGSTHHRAHRSIDERELRPESTPVPFDDGSTDSNDTPSQDPGDGTAGDGAVGMRVLDDGRTDGLLQSIVGGVTGFFLGG